VRQTFEIPLDIPDVTIENVTTNRLGHIEITVKSTVEGVPCHQCGKMSTKFYGEDREITLRHLPILGRRTYIRLRPKRYVCPDCQGNPTTTQKLSWYTPRSSFTRAYEEQLLLILVSRYPRAYARGTWELKPEIQLYFARIDFLLKLNIPFDDIFIDPDCGGEKTNRPKFIPPVNLLDPGKALANFPTRVGFDLSHDLRHCLRGGNHDHQVHMINLNAQRLDFNVRMKCLDVE
jgi:zinc-finger of transposase IS204/IS1001/IS1096/IS1165